MEDKGLPLRLLGYWKENGVNDPWIHPKYLVDKNWKIEMRPALLKYLKSGIRIHEMLGYSHCRLSKIIPDEQMGNAELTDGVYVWPEGLPIYVEKFGVKLPNEFIAHAEKSNFCIPSNLDVTDLENRAVDIQFWKNWCLDQRPKSLWQLLRKKK